MNWSGQHLKRWWVLYALIAGMMIVSLVMLERASRAERRQMLKTHPELVGENYDLIAVIGDCKVYQLINQKNVKLTICEKSNATMAAF